MDLKQLRDWHQSRVDSHRKSQARYQRRLDQGHSQVFYNERKTTDHKRDGDFHLECVRAIDKGV